MFETHKLNETGFDKVRGLKETMNKAAKEVLAFIPDGRDKSIFITKLEEGMFFATRAIAAQEGNHTEVIKYEV